jgi:uncharacterized protein (TIGR00369 family)
MAARRVASAQNVSSMCLVCGVDNPASLGARFYELADGDVVGQFSPRQEHQGYPGRMHGGMITALLDETIGRAINVGEPDTWGVTMEFTTKFRRPVPLDAEIRVIGRITNNTGRVFEGAGEIVLADGTIAAEGRGRYLKMALSAITDEAFVREQWFADERPIPSEVEV